MKEERTQWPTRETVWLIGRRVYLKNEDDFVTLNIVGYKPRLTVWYHDEVKGGWHRVHNLESKYQEWAFAAKEAGVRWQLSLIKFPESSKIETPPATNLLSLHACPYNIK